MTPAATLAHLQLAETDHDDAEERLGPARGILAGVLLGAALWIVILALVLPRFI